MACAVVLGTHAGRHRAALINLCGAKGLRVAVVRVSGHTTQVKVGCTEQFGAFNERDNSCFIINVSINITFSVPCQTDASQLGRLSMQVKQSKPQTTLALRRYTLRINLRRIARIMKEEAV